MGKTMGLDINGADRKELVEDHKEELMMGALSKLKSGQQKVLFEEQFTEEEKDRAEVNSDVIKPITGKWSKPQDSLRSITLT